MTDLLPPPEVFGLPEKFKSWRLAQPKAVLELIDSRERFIIQIQPTGSGKSLCYITSAILTGGRTLVLTSLKGLQRQIMSDFGDLGIALVMGRSSYRCAVRQVSAEWGPCRLGSYCHKKREGGCPYYDAIANAKKSKIVVTNYSFWHSNKPGVLGAFDLLVCDEAHNAVSHLIDSLSTGLTKKEVQSFGYTYLDRADDPWVWVAELRDKLKGDMKSRVDDIGAGIANASVDMLKTHVRLLNKLDNLVGRDRGQWVVEYFTDRIDFDPIWPPEFAEKMLFRDIPKVLLTSATMGHSTLRMLGIDDDSDHRVTEYPSDFPIDRRPIYHVPTTRVDHRIDNLGYGLWCNRIDQIISTRLDRKGIIHTVSYDRRNRIRNVSEFAVFFHHHDSKGIQKALEKFGAAQPPAILVSPSVVTGWDFPYDKCEYQIIGKIPFPDHRRKVDKVRKERDPDHGCCIAMQNLVQACGRGMRYRDDQCENIIIDDHFVWFVKKYAKFAPKWFLDAVRMERTIPKPPRALDGK